MTRHILNEDGYLQSYIVRNNDREALAVVKLIRAPACHSSDFIISGRMMYAAIKRMNRRYGPLKMPNLEPGNIWNSPKISYYFEHVSDAHYDSIVELDMLPQVYTWED